MGSGVACRVLASFAVLAAMTSSCLAGDGISPNSDIKLGPIPHYADESAARVACKPDSVVWADQKSGFYYPKFFPEYGTTQHGTYTCYRQAEKADYWSLTPTSDSGHMGREFPMFFCYSCS